MLGFWKVNTGWMIKDITTQKPEKLSTSQVKQIPLFRSKRTFPQNWGRLPQKRHLFVPKSNIWLQQWCFNVGGQSDFSLALPNIEWGQFVPFPKPLWCLEEISWIQNWIGLLSHLRWIHIAPSTAKSWNVLVHIFPTIAPL